MKKEIPQYDERMFQEFYKMYGEKLALVHLVNLSEEEYVTRLCELMFIGWRYGKLQTFEAVLDKSLGNIETAMKELLGNA